MFQHHLQMRVHFSKQEYLLHMFIISMICIWCIFTRLCATLMITIICGTITNMFTSAQETERLLVEAEWFKVKNLKKKLKTSVSFLLQALMFKTVTFPKRHENGTNDHNDKENNKNENNANNNDNC